MDEVKRYTYIWEFRVRPGVESEFERHYGPAGTWAGLFRSAPGYLDTRLLKDRDVAGRYLTVDRWESLEAYRAFRETFRAEHDALDRTCEALTLEERPLGTYEE